MPVLTVHDTGDGQRAETPAQVLDGIRREASARLLPLLGETLRIERHRLEAERALGVAEGRGVDILADDLAGISVLSAELIRHEQRWQKALSDVFAAWPDSPVSRRVDQFSLVSDAQLQAQLIGQPVAEALERRFDSVRDIVDRRLHSMAMAMGYRQRPSNPLAPRCVVECFLQAFDAGDCRPHLRSALLRRYEVLLDVALGALYAWVNTRLAESGHALAGESDHVALLASLGVPTDGIPGRHQAQWGDVGAAQPVAAWRSGGPLKPAHAPRPADAPRGTLLRRFMRRLHDAQGATAHGGSQSFRPEEFQAALSLLQAERVLPDAGEAHAWRIREGLRRVAAGLGINEREVGFSPDQEDTIALVGLLFDRLAARYLLVPEIGERLSLLALPYLYLALDDPQLFEPSTPPAMQLLSLLIDLWDGNDGSDDSLQDVLALADRASSAILEAAHGDGRVFPSQLAQIDAALAPTRRRAEAAERRAWQAVRGRERLDAARHQAHGQVAARLRGRALLPTVASFLDSEWRQALVQAWLREGADSDRYREMLSLGDALLDVDALAAGSGGAVADRLLGILPALRDCCTQCGLDETAIDVQMAALVAEHASPTPRSVHGSGPGQEDTGASADEAACNGTPAGIDGFAEGQRFVQPGAAGAARLLRLAWRSELTGACLLVDPAGTKALLLPPAQLQALIADGELQPRPLGGPVAVALEELALRARSA